MLAETIPQALLQTLIIATQTEINPIELSISYFASLLSAAYNIQQLLYYARYHGMSVSAYALNVMQVKD